MKRLHAWCRRSSCNSLTAAPIREEHMWRQAAEEKSKFAEPSGPTESATMSAKWLLVRRRGVDFKLRVS